MAFKTFPRPCGATVHSVDGRFFGQVNIRSTFYTTVSVIIIFIRIIITEKVFDYHFHFFFLIFRISHGTEEKQKFLSKYYLGNPEEGNSGKNDIIRNEKNIQIYESKNTTE